MKKILFVLFTALVLTFHLSGEMLFGGTGLFTMGTILNSDTIVQSELLQTNTINPQFSVWSNYYSLFVSGSIEYLSPYDQIEFDVEELLIELYPFDFMSIKGGLFNYLPGTGEIFSTANHFSGLDYQKIFSDSLEQAIVPNEIIQTSLFFMNSYLTLTVAPFKMKTILSEIDSLWFPDKDFPVYILFHFPTDRLFERGVIYHEDSKLPDTVLEDSSFSAEFGTTFFNLDLTAIYYHGWDNSMLFTAGIEFPAAFPETFDIVLTPHNKKIDVFSFLAAGNFRNIRLWADMSYTLSKTFLSNNLSTTEMETLTEESPFFEYTAGAGYNFSFTNLMLIAEYSGNWVVENTNTIEKPFLDSSLSLIIDWQTPKRTFSFSPVFIMAIPDKSLLSMLKLSYSPDDTFQFSIASPVFRGEKDTIWGQFNDSYYISSTLILRY